MSSDPHVRVLFLLAGLVGIFGLTACEENLGPRNNLGMPFSMYGVLSPDLLVQSIRVYPMEDFPTLGSSEPIDASVFSTDLETGKRITWRDTVVTDPNGQHEYIYWAPFRAEFGHRYRVEAVRRTDGASSYADVRIPPVASVRIEEEEGPALHVLIEGEDIRALIPEAEYLVGSPERGPFHVATFSYQGKEEQVENGWRVTLNMIGDYEDIRFQVHAFNDCGRVLTLEELTLHVLVGDADWDPPHGFFESNLISHPRTMSNVENGFGFIGGGYRLAVPLFPSQNAVERACFIYVW